MKVLHVNSKEEAVKLNELIKKGNDVFILIYMDGCGPCMATKPEWLKLEQILKSQYEDTNNLVIVDLNKDYLNLIQDNSLGDINGFPTMKYLKDGKVMEEYEKSVVRNKNRSVDSFIEWIDSKMLKVVSVEQSSPELLYKRLNRKTRLNKRTNSNKRTRLHKRKTRKRKTNKNK